jgi:hypothetical protein
MANPALAHALAASFLAGEPELDSIAGRAAHTLGRPYRWLRPLAARYLKAFAGQTRPRHRDVVRFLKQDPAFTRHRRRLAVEHWLPEPQRMQPVAAAAAWDIPPLESVGALAEWLRITASELAWFADLKALTYKNPSPRLTHYHYRIRTKPSGDERLIESPKPRLKAIQRQILTGILDRIPPHPAVHGFIRHRSIRSFVAPHTGQRIVLRIDLRDFFPTFAAARIQTFFRTAGYPESVADLLGGLCTNAARLPDLPFDARRFYARPHLPQGAPTSPSLANLCFRRVDCRLRGLAESAGAVYTRYADDLAFSGGDHFERRVHRFAAHVAAILSEEGFAVNHRKTRIMRQGVRQKLAGLVANRHLNLPRKDFDLLKATLTNCIRHGPATQNREAHADFRAHLAGRIAFAESVNPTKATRLRALFDQIRWS